MTAIRKIAVIGGTGMLGIPVTTALCEAGFAVTALARDPGKARQVLPGATAIAQADVRDEASLRRGLEGQDGLYLSLSIAPHERKGDFHAEAEGLELILAAARSAGIKRIGYLSALVQDSPSDWWVLDVWRKAIARIKGSGIPSTIFYPTNFMETLPHKHMVGGTLVLMGASRHRNYWIAGSDFGRQVARSFQIPEAANRGYVIQGPEPMTYHEAAHRYARAGGTPMRVVTLPLPLIRLLGTVSQSMRFNARIMSTVLGYPEEFGARATWRDLGRPSTTIEDFARRA